MAAVTLLVGASAASAQSPPVKNGWVTVAFKSASANEDGFIHGNVDVDYSFRVCSGEVKVMYGVRAGSVNAFNQYWWHGHEYGVPAGTRAPDEAPFTAEVRVSHNATVYYRGQKSPYVTRDLGCGFGSQWISVGPVSKFDPKAKTDIELQDMLNRFDFDIGITNAPMRSADVENAFAQQVAAAQQQAAQQAQKARQDSLARERLAQARRDSTTRAAAERAEAARRDASRATAAGTATSPSAGSASSTSTTTAGAASMSPATTRVTAADRAEAARRFQAEQAAADRANRQRQLAELERQREVRAAQDSVTSANIAEGAQAVGQLFSIIGDIRASNKAAAEKKAEWARRQREEYYLAARTAYFQRAPNRQCGAAEPRQLVKPGTPLGATFTGAECELSDSNSAAFYEFTIGPKPMAVKVYVSGSGLMNAWGSVRRIDGSPVGKAGETVFEPGRYAINVSTAIPGETGGYSVSVVAEPLWGRGTKSLVAYGQGGSASIAGAKSSSYALGGRFGYGLSERVAAIITGDVLGIGSGSGGDAYTLLQGGGRVDLLSSAKKNRQLFAQYTVGMISYDNDNEYAMVNTLGAGVELFVTQRVALELLASHAASSFKNPVSDSGPKVKFANDGLALGLSFR